MAGAGGMQAPAKLPCVLCEIIVVHLHEFVRDHPESAVVTHHRHARRYEPVEACGIVLWLAQNLVEWSGWE